MRTTLNNQRGTTAVLFAILLIVLLGFGGLAIDVGSWYVVQAELSKSVDAAALAGARNISNPYIDPLVIAQQYGSENFPAGLLGTSATFNGVQDTNHGISVTGSANAPAYLARLFGINQVAMTGSGVARKYEVEIMLVLDRSGSMSGTPIADLKTAAKSFVSFFQDTQDKDKMGLISFATGVTVDFALGNNYVDPMTKPPTDYIGNLNAVGATNAEDALAQTIGPSGFSDQTGVPGDKRVAQFVIFFTDGMPTAFRGKFRNQDNVIDAVACGTGNTCDTVYPYMGQTNTENWLSIDPEYTGDGKSSGSKCGYYNTTQWFVFALYPLPPYTNTDLQYCFIPSQNLASYICSTARQMTLDNAQVLKNRYIKIYTIGLGPQADGTFLTQVASGADFYHYAPNSSALQAIFNTIAKDIKLRLVQ
jgi:Flp pilus assembly protein TadG